MMASCRHIVVLVNGFFSEASVFRLTDEFGHMPHAVPR
jgi:hypothetical protein